MTTGVTCGKDKHTVTGSSLSSAITGSSIIRIGTRASALARWQTDYVSQMLTAAWPDITIDIKVISTRGDRIIDVPLPEVGGKGLFTAELEEELRSGQIDLAVHSLKDLPTEDPEGLVVGAIPVRVDPSDVLVSRNGYTIDTLPEGATVGTSSHRRAGQLLNKRPDLRIADIRGNIDTRINKALDPAGEYAAVILARAGLERLGFLEHISQVISRDIMLPAPGQGALGIQCRKEEKSLKLVQVINDYNSAISVMCERAFLARLGGGCSVPIAAYATIDETSSYLIVRGRISNIGGTGQIEVNDKIKITGSISEDIVLATGLGNRLAKAALATDGATEYLELSK